MPVEQANSLVKYKRYTDEQILHHLDEIESGKVVRAVYHDHGVSEQTVCR